MLDHAAAILVLENQFKSCVVVDSPAFDFHLFETDEFHPVDSDIELDHAINRVHREGKSADRDLIWELFADAAYSCLLEMYDKACDFYSDAMNHPPGYKPIAVHMKESQTFDSAAERAATLLMQSV